MPSLSPPAEVPLVGFPELADALRETAFRKGGSVGLPPRIGAEAELLPLSIRTGWLVPPTAPSGPSTLPLLRDHARRHGWREAPSATGLPYFLTASGGAISYEPGGQIEYSAPPCPGVPSLLRDLNETVLPLGSTLADAGIRLRALGVDPCTPHERVGLELRSLRYLAMDSHLGRRGPAGRRMMRQSASFQVNLDWEGNVLEQWRLLNAAAPFFTAVFANSRLHEGRDTGAASFRSLLWRELDPARTGLHGRSDDPVAEYLEFALDAEAILVPGEHPPTFRELVERGEASRTDWLVHLTTLFPEIRPRGFLEIRSIDAVEPECFAAPLVWAAGLAYDAAARSQALELLGAPDPLLLRAAGLYGLADPEIGPRALQLVEIGLAGARRLPHPLIDADSLDRAEAFFDCFTRAGRAPADRALNLEP